MRYSKEQIEAIQQRKKNIQREISISNKRNKAIQEVLVDHLLDESLLDKRNHGDVENDLFARKALLNDYSNELIKGNSYEFQQRIMEEGFDEFFLNNFPKIKSEARMYRVPNSSNMFDLVKKLYNISQRELELINDKTNFFDYESQIVNSVNEIKDNLENLKNLKTISKQQRQEYNDALLRISALLQVIEMVDTKIEVMKQLFGSDANVLQALEDLKQSTQLPTNPNQPIQPINQQTLQNINQQTLQQALNSNQPGTPPQTPPSTPPLQTPPSSPKPTSQKKRVKLIVEDSDEEEPVFKAKTIRMSEEDDSDALMMQFGSDLMTFSDEDYNRLQNLTRQPNVNRKSFASYLSKLTQGLFNINQIGYNKSKSKEEMFKYFMKNKLTILNHLSTIAENERRRTMMVERDEEIMRTRLEEDRRRALESKMNDLRNKINSINDIEMRIDIVLNQGMEEFPNLNSDIILTKREVKSKLTGILNEARKSFFFSTIFRGLDGRMNGSDLYDNMASNLIDARNELNAELTELMNNP